MLASKLPDWIYLMIHEDDQSKYLTVYSRLHIAKEVRVGPIYSLSFSNREILRDLSGEISRRFLNAY